MNDLYANILNTPIGQLLALANQDALCYLFFLDEEFNEELQLKLEKKYNRKFQFKPHPILEKTAFEIAQYFSGELEEFSILCHLTGSSFQKEVWESLCAIPYGITRNYKQQATSIGNPQAIRAMAKANGSNPIAIIVPCHRIIGSDGSLTGYAGGLWRKKYLLDLEASRNPAGKQFSLFDD